MSWVRSFAISAIENQTIMLAVRPGHRDMAKFFNESRKAQLAAMIQAMTGRRITLEIVKSDDHAQLDPGPASTSESAAAPSGRPGRVSADERRDALNLSLVKAVCDLFETQLLDVRPEPPAPPESPEPSADKTESDDPDV